MSLDREATEEIKHVLSIKEPIDSSHCTKGGFVLRGDIAVAVHEHIVLFHNRIEHVLKEKASVRERDLQDAV